MCMHALCIFSKGLVAHGVGSLLQFELGAQPQRKQNDGELGHSVVRAEHLVKHVLVPLLERQVDHVLVDLLTCGCSGLCPKNMA